MSELAEDALAHLASVQPESAAPPWAANATRPFVGLRPFNYQDHPFFFGREAHTRELYRMLDRSRFVAVVGSSGGGKSSLVRAGLRPLLEREGREVAGRAWVWAELRPGDAPINRLARAIAELDPTAATGSDPKALTLARAERIETTLRRSSLGLVQALGQFRSLHDETLLLLLVDQFEELFRYANLRETTRCDAITQAERLDEATAFVQLLLDELVPKNWTDGLALDLISNTRERIR
jgi:hypothetical protein